MAQERFTDRHGKQPRRPAARPPKHHRSLPLRVEPLEERTVPSASLLLESFDTTAPGALPAGWSQWSSTPAASFGASTALALSGTEGLAVNATLSTASARAWPAAAQPADVQVSSAVYLTSAIPAQVFCREHTDGKAASLKIIGEGLGNLATSP